MVTLVILSKGNAETCAFLKPQFSRSSVYVTDEESATRPRYGKRAKM